MAAILVPLTRTRFRYVLPYVFSAIPNCAAHGECGYERMKKKREHIVPLATQVVKLFTDLERIFYWRACFSLNPVKNAKYQRYGFAQQSPS